MKEKEPSKLRDLHLSHWMLLCVSIVFSWFLWCIVNFSEYRQFSGWPMVLEVIKDLAEQIVETTILLELSLLYIKGIVKIFWDKEKNIKNLILQVMLLAMLNGISSVVSGWVYSEHLSFLIL